MGLRTVVYDCQVAGSLHKNCMSMELAPGCLSAWCSFFVNGESIPSYASQTLERYLEDLGQPIIYR
jgi:hypothetical protein